MFSENELRRMTGDDLKPGPGNSASDLLKMLGAQPEPLTEQQQKERLTKAIQEGRAGVSRTTHFIVCLEDEPDAIPIPYSAVFDPARQEEVKQHIAEATAPKFRPVPSGPNFTPPKQKRKKKARNGNR